MEHYTEQDVLRLGRRIHNAKRSYLLVDPLQGKHIPVSPTETCRMARALGERLLQEAPEARMVIGFAETATAIAALAALSFPEDTIYLHTTREPLDSDQVVRFLEEHSHAVDQQIDCRLMTADRSQTIVMIDDEISTGRTIDNIVTQLRQTFPFLGSTRFVIGSIINRMEPDVREEMSRRNIHFVSLVQVMHRDFETAAQRLSVMEPQEVPATRSVPYQIHTPVMVLPNLRTGVDVKRMAEDMGAFAHAVEDFLTQEDRCHGRLLLLGTEECMTPAILTGQWLESRHPSLMVRSHATTRSPIGVAALPDYPCQNGYRLSSFYEDDRITYLYNIADYDTVVVITDSRRTANMEQAMQQIGRLYNGHCQSIYLIRG